MRTARRVLSYGYNAWMRALVIAPESSEASSENDAVEARSAPVALRSVSRMKSMSGVSTTRDESARQTAVVLAIGVVTHVIVARCAASVAAMTAGCSA